MEKATSQHTVSRSIADQLLQEINDQIYPIGSRLPSERVLAERFKVSRPTVREAIHHLESFGCVETRIGAGTYVKATDMSQIAESFSNILGQGTVMNCDVIEVRMILDIEIAAMAAVRRTNEQLQMLYENIEEMRRAMINQEEWECYDEQFHILLSEATNNPILYSLIQVAKGIYTYTIHLSALTGSQPLRTYEQHMEILRAVENRDARRARSAMRQHIVRTLYHPKDSTEKADEPSAQ